MSVSATITCEEPDVTLHAPGALMPQVPSRYHWVSLSSSGRWARRRPGRCCGAAAYSTAGLAASSAVSGPIAAAGPCTS